MDTNQTQSALDAGKLMMKPTTVEINNIPHLVHHRDLAVSKHEELLNQPTSLREQVNLHSVESFIEYFNNFADEGSHIFVDIDNAKFKAVIDYHFSTASPRWNRHTVAYQFPKTVEWSKWLNSDGEKMDQVNFALFIEDNIKEIIEPAGAEMLEIATSLQAKNNVSFKSATRLDNGETQFDYREDIESSAGANGQLNIPTEIKLALKPFQGSETYNVTARFRYRITQGQLIMWYDIVRPHAIIEDATNDAFEKVKSEMNQGVILMGDCPA
ncbi:YfdQ family protein [Bermanella sp. R86510]|uniref:YfdQ family protein n=1 Tax=unclassified Bermanella TaxID=2627862 RepID=UPI0037CB56CB